jgi:hypothetical protein
MGICSDRVFACGQACLGPCSAAFDIDVQRLHSGEIEYDSAFCGAVPGIAVAAAAYGELHSGLTRQRYDAGDVVRIRNPGDDRRPAVVPAVEYGARLIIFGILRVDHPALDPGAELLDEVLVFS